jgi:holo-[acyl-carrier protein] synthase
VILGIGADLVEVPRVERLLTRYGERFARRVLAPREWPGFERSVQRPLFLASRFAAKEAFAKALGTGLRGAVSLTSIAVVNDPLGKPGIALAPGLEALVAERGLTACHVTLSHERSVACAFVVLEGRS